MAAVLNESKPDNCEILADLPGMDQNGSTIPPDILLTTSRPDLVILNREDKKIFLLELTCSFESNVDSANITKTLKYTQIKQDIEENVTPAYYFRLKLDQEVMLADETR